MTTNKKIEFNYIFLIIKIIEANNKTKLLSRHVTPAWIFESLDITMSVFIAIVLS